MAKQDGGLFKSQTKNGYELMLVRSSLQKMIRRGSEWEAQYWLDEMIESNFHNYAAYTLALIAVEDIGPADPALLGTINSTLNLWNFWTEKRKKTTCSYWLGLTTVLIMMCRAQKKSRIADDLYSVMREKKKSGLKLPIPDVAKDSHNNEGRSMGRENAHWCQVGDTVIPEATEEDLGGTSYRDQAHEMWMSVAKDKHVHYELSNPKDHASDLIVSQLK